MTDLSLLSKNRPSHWFGEVAGAFADVGTFLPLVIGVLMIGSFDAVGVLIGFGVFAIATGVLYRRPVPVQPMKAITALVIVGGLSAGEVAASGLILGTVLLVLGATGLFKQLDRWVPRPVLSGIQLALGLSLVWVAFEMAGKNLITASVLLVLLYVLRLTRFSILGTPALLIAGVLWSLWQLDTMTSMPDLQWHLPVFNLPSLADLVVALKSAVIPQFAMTLTNAILLTAVLAADYFPDNADRDRLKPRNLAVTTGLFNLLLAPFGALPMCHGAGDLQHITIRAQTRDGRRLSLACVVCRLGCLQGRRLLCG